MKLVSALAFAGLVAQTTAAACGSCTGCLWTYAGGTQCFDASAAPKVACDGWGADYTWCGAGSGTTTATPTTATPTTATPTTAAPTTTTPTSTTTKPTATTTMPVVTTATPTNSTTPKTSVLFSPYIDLAMGHGSTLASTMGSVGIDTITLAFATGECGSENWGGQPPSATLSVINSLVAAKKKYIIATGGAAAAFTCGSDENFLKFIKTYKTDYLVGIDFDIETGMYDATINSLMQRIKNSQSTYPNLRYSFTIATLGGAVTDPYYDPLSGTGAIVVKSLLASGIQNYVVNLMAMDYGASSWVCVMKGDVCDMGASAKQACIDVNKKYNIPISSMELTVMIGGNDVQTNVFEIGDVATVSSYAKQNKLAGVHFWSFDRDNDCAPGVASPTCNTYGKAGTYGFTKEFVKQLA